MMSDLFNIVGVVHFGIAGNANNSLSIGDVTVPKYVAYTGIWKWLVSLFLIASSQSFTFQSF